MKIGITYNIKEDLALEEDSNSERLEEFDSFQTIIALSGVLESLGFETVKLGGDICIIEKIKEAKPDFIFNIAEGFWGRNREAHIPAILEMMNLPYSGSDPLTLSLTLDKIMSKKFAKLQDIPTPDYFIVSDIRQLNCFEAQLRFPLITKPAYEGSSKGIYLFSLVKEPSELKRNVSILMQKYPDQPILVEEYIQGREFTVGVQGNADAKVLGIMEIKNKNKSSKNFIYSLEVKRNWQNEVEYVAAPELKEDVKTELQQYALKAFKEFGCRDIARLDFRVSCDNQVYLLEINPLPGLRPGYSDLVIMAQKQGMAYNELIGNIIKNAFSRYKISCPGNLERVYKL